MASTTEMDTAQVPPPLTNVQNIPGMITITHENSLENDLARNESLPMPMVPNNGAQHSNSLIIGPKVRLHRFNIGRRTLQTAGSIWLLGGFSFLFVVSLCCIVNVGYSTYKSQTSITFLPVMGFILYTSILWSYLMSLMRTAVRIAIRIWNAKFGSSEEVYALRWVDRYAAKYELIKTESKAETVKGKRHFTFCLNCFPFRCCAFHYAGYTRRNTAYCYCSCFWLLGYR